MKLRPVITYAVAAAVGGYVVGLAADTLGVIPLVASIPVVVALVLFAWFRRNEELIDVLVPAFFIAYAGYVGIAVARVTHAVIFPAAAFPIANTQLHELRPLSEEWLLVFAAGLPYALLLTVAVAFPVSMLPDRPKAQTQDDDALGKFLHARNTPGGAPNDPPNG